MFGASRGADHELMFPTEIAPAQSTPRIRALVAALAAVCALFAAGHVASADAAITCQFSTGGALTIQADAASDAPKIVRSVDTRRSISWIGMSSLSRCVTRSIAVMA